jgi:hypothetical protein
MDINDNRDRVLSIWEYVDQPIKGVAIYKGMPHWFDRIFDQKRDEYSNRFWLTPLDERLCSLELECRALFDSWRREFDVGKVSIATHPGLSGPQTRFSAAKAELDSGIENIRDQRMELAGRFVLIDPAARERTPTSFYVVWDS